MANEYSSAQLAALASRVLKGYEPSAFEARQLAACVLTQTRDKPKRTAKKKTAKK